MKHQAKIQYFDFLSKLILMLFQKNSVFFSDSSKRRTTQDNPAWNQEVNALLEKYPQLENASVICMYGIDKATAEAVMAWAERQEFFPLLTLIRTLDRVISWEDQMKLTDTLHNSGRGFSALNGNSKETGIVLYPRVPSFQDNRTPFVEEAVPVRKWQSYFAPGINQELKNIYCVLEDDLKLGNVPCKIRHCIVATGMTAGRTLRIGLLPLLRDAELKVDFYSRPTGIETQNLFSLAGIKNWERVKARIRAGWLEACRKGIDIAILPECLGGPELFSSNAQYSAFFDGLAQEAEIAGYAAPQLTIGPSCWSEHHNRLYVMDGSGNYVCIQEKYFPFEYSKNGQTYLEDIQPGKPMVSVLHIPRLGRIGLAVCADLLHKEMTDLLIQTLHCNFVICPSFSQGKTLFSLICKTGVSYGATAIWLNSCSAYRKPEDIVGVIASPVQNISLRAKCGGRCGGDNAACLFIADIDLDTGEFLAPQHICPPNETGDT